jgi:geranylgeranyl reductase family protein
MKYDVLIVGGGPAGSVAGINFIGSGLRVAILDRARFPRLKPCGGGISCRVYDRFSYIEPLLRSIPTSLVRKVVLESPAGNTVLFESDKPLYAMIRRIEFDQALLDACRKGGIEVKEGVTVSTLEVSEDDVRLTSTSGEEFVANLVIGADGVNSTVAVKAGLRGPWRPEQVAVDGTEESPGSLLKANPDTLYVYFGKGGGYGYGYVFPKVSHVNFGVGYLLEYVKKKVPAKPYEQHLSFFEDLKTRGVIAGHSERSNFHFYPLPFAGPLRRISTRRILLAGDAAGFVNGFTAEGIYYAMVSGEHAGKSALAAIRAHDASALALRRYDEACKAEVGHELWRSVALQRRFFPRPALIDLVVEFACHDRSARTLIAGFGTGQLSYEQMKMRVLLEAMPGFLRYQAKKLQARFAQTKSRAYQ